MTLRLLAAGSAVCLSVASAAAPLFVPDTEGNWPRAVHPFVDRRSLQHDALAIGLDAAPGAPEPSSGSVRFVAAPPAPPLLMWVSSRPPSAERRAVAVLRPGGVNALVRVDGVTTDVGDVWNEPRYPPAELASDLRRLAPLDLAPAARELPVDELHPDDSWMAAPATLAAAALLLLAVSVMLAITLMVRGRPRADTRGTRDPAALAPRR